MNIKFNKILKAQNGSSFFTPLWKYAVKTGNYRNPTNGIVITVPRQGNWYDDRFDEFDISKYQRTPDDIRSRASFPKFIGKRYFYTDINGNKHWVSPEQAEAYGYDKQSGIDSEEINDTIWTDYELKGKTGNNMYILNPTYSWKNAVKDTADNTGGSVEEINYERQEKPGFFNTIGKAIGNPNLIEGIRLMGSLASNQGIYDASLKAIKPNLKQTYLTHRQVVGDEATKQAYYRRGIEGITKASQPFTSDADKQMAYQMEAQRQANELKAQGDLADNQEIRRTSDESNQHQWANTQRATDIANYNTEQFNVANAAKYNLLAQKRSADWTSWDNFLKSKEYRIRQKQADYDSMQDSIWMLQTESEIQNDQDIQLAQQKLYEAKKANTNNNGVINYTDAVIKAQKEYDDLLRQKQIELMRKRPKYNYSIWSAKTGTKITRKRKEDLLYKSARDAVEHFRKMTKLQDDSYQKSRKSHYKLIPHPRKMQQGGVAPFTVFTPVALGGETSVTSGSVSGGSSKGTSSKDDNGKELLDLLKSLFQKVDGLPIDVSSVYTPMINLLNKVQYSGGTMSAQEMATAYLQSMQTLGQVKHGKEVFTAAKQVATSNDALGDFAVTNRGTYFVQGEDGRLKEVGIDSIDNGQNRPLTNGQLLYLREYSPELAFEKGDYIMESVVNNAIGMTKIAEEIKKLASNLGSTEQTIEGFTKKQSNDIKKGLEMLADAPDGIYKGTNYTKEQSQQIKLAQSYIEKMLPLNMKAVLAANATLQGTTPKKLISESLNLQHDISTKQEWTPLTGKAASGNGENELNDEKISNNPLLSMQREIGGTYKRYNIVTRDSNTRMSVNGTNYSALPKIKDNMSIDVMLSESGIDGIIDSKYGITFGDQQINPQNLKDIMYSNTGNNIIVTLPCKIVNGNKQVNLEAIDLYKEAEEKALERTRDRNSQEYVIALGEELRNVHLDGLLDSNGLPDKNKVGQFLVVEAYTTDRIPLNKDSQYIEKVRNPDSNLENMISRALSTDNKKSDYSIDINDKLFEFGYDDVYRGTMFIPLNNNPVAAMNSWGTTIKVGQSQDLEELYQISEKSAKFNNVNSY